MASRDFTGKILSASVVLRLIDGTEFEWEFGGRPDMVVGWANHEFDQHEIGSGLFAEYVAGRERAIVTLAGGVTKSGKRAKVAEPEPVNAAAEPEPRDAYATAEALLSETTEPYVSVSVTASDVDDLTRTLRQIGGYEAGETDVLRLVRQALREGRLVIPAEALK